MTTIISNLYLGPAGPAAVGSAVGKALDTAVQVRHGLL